MAGVYRPATYDYFSIQHGVKGKVFKPDNHQPVPLSSGLTGTGTGLPAPARIPSRRNEICLGRRAG